MENLTKFYSANCGLVIVHPFLQKLFSVLNYIDHSNQFKNKESQSRAVYLLYFIATGQSTIVDKSDLLMPKVMCGMPIQHQVLISTINDHEKTTALEMLEALISHWEKLGSTSADGLRNTFLKRSGVLELEANTYQLTIETSGTDILLDFIPWTINLINLPWMEHLMSVSWR